MRIAPGQTHYYRPYNTARRRAERSARLAPLLDENGEELLEREAGQECIDRVARTNRESQRTRKMMMLLGLPPRERDK